MKHVPPPAGEPVELDLLTAAVDAYSISPAIRLRWQILMAKAAQRPPQAVLPPTVGEPRNARDNDDFAVACAFDDDNILARLMMLRADAAAEVERLLTFLDSTEGIVDDEECGDEQDSDLAGSASDREGDQSDDEPSLGWPDGRIGQFATGGSDDREQADEPRLRKADHSAFLKRHYCKVKPIAGDELKNG